MGRMHSLLLAALLVTPVGLAAQVEIGVDAGYVLDAFDEVEDQFGSFTPDDQTTIAFPTPWLRVAFGASEAISVETMASLTRFSSDGDAITTILLLPGVNVALGDGGFYVRGEAGL